MPFACLTTDTSSRWLKQVLADLPTLLVDHAYCEQKAAASAMSLVARYPGLPRLVTAMVHLAQEELRHFERLHALIVRRGIPMAPMGSDPYVKALLALGRKDGDGHLIDRLLLSSLVEARSCERFQLLAAQIPDAELASLYRELALSEEGHHRLFVGLAEQVAPATEVASRLAELASQEAEILDRLPVEVRMH